ncbi:MAG: efflux transporter periplasmic adaptor subunit [Bacteroidetes bacterium CG12_big_fil_rev_8_21_14_0_65_60_17]|nr:MAG: efflux transporter periplasmic adaptor subunit [Bacteroidetes bacterium CG12_big_fil_rev_8_21_14_0_65_60_17]
MMPLLRLCGTAVFAVVLLVGCGSDSKSTSGAGGAPPRAQGGPQPTAVEVVQARVGSLPLQERMSGIVRADNQVTVFSEISAPVERVAVRNGDRVKRGDALVYLRDQQFQDQLRQAEAQLQINEADAGRTQAALNEANASYKRVQELVSKGLQSQQQLEMAESNRASAQAAHEQAQARIAQAEATVQERREALRRTIVRAPFGGLVGQRGVEPGMRIDPSTPLFMIGDFETVRVEVSVIDNMMGNIEPGQTAMIIMENRPDTVIAAQVSRISPFLEAGSFSAAAEIDVPNPGGVLRPGMFVAVDVAYGESEQATLVPESALFEHPTSGKMGVYIAPSLAQETPVREPDEYESDNPPPLTEPTPVSFIPVDILARGRGVAGVSGISLGDWVVTIGQDMLAIRTGSDLVARARPVTWPRVALLQDMQDQDLLIEFMEKQQRMADSIASERDREASSSSSSSSTAQ